MKRKFNTTIISTAILSLVFVVALSVAWAANTYSGSIVVQKAATNPSTITLVSQGNDRIQIDIREGTLDDYMTEEGITAVTITADLTEQWVDTGGGTGYYMFSFEFGPSEAFFEPNPVVLTVKGKYVSTNTEFWLYDENGEAIVGTRYDNADKIKFEIPHFSCYYYEGYCY